MMISGKSMVFRPEFVNCPYSDCVSYIVYDVDLNLDLDIDFHLRGNMSIFDGRTNDTVYPIQVDVGVGDLLPKHKFDFRKLDGKDVVRPIINMFHEAEHVH